MFLAFVLKYKERNYAKANVSTKKAPPLPRTRVL